MSKYCILYSYFETEKSKEHLEFFLKNGIQNRKEVFYIFVIANYNYSVEFPNQSNIKIIPRENVGHDFSSWKVGLDSTATNDFDYFIFMNDTVCGPYIPRYISQDITWYTMFCNLLSEEIKLSGLTINYYPWQKVLKSGEHVQSMMFCTDKIGLDILKKEIFHIEPDQMQNIYNNNRKQFILNFEIGMSRKIIEYGYKIAALYICDMNEKYKTGDIWNNNKYFNTTINPFETLFIKKNRIDSPIIRLYTEQFTR